MDSLSLNLDILNAQLKSTEWGVWGKEAYTFSPKAIKKKHDNEINVLQSLTINIPERLLIGLRYSYGICDLNAYAKPLSENEFLYLKNIYYEAKQYTQQLVYPGLKELAIELFLINKTASGIEGFQRGVLVNETNNYDIWRKYFYLDFFKFSYINFLIREKLENIEQYSNDVFAARLVLAYFLGSGSFKEKASIFFSISNFQIINERVIQIVNSFEQSLEFPDYNVSIYRESFIHLMQLIKKYRINGKLNLQQELFNRRFEPLEICNDFYKAFYNLIPDIDDSNQIETNEKPLKALKKLHNEAKNKSYLAILKELRIIRKNTDAIYKIPDFTEENLTIENFFKKTNHSYFQAMLYEGKILYHAFQKKYPDSDELFKPIFNELIPFYSIKYNPQSSLIPLNNKNLKNLPRLILAHHVHNANCDKLGDKMAINKLIQWDNDNLVFTVSSSSSKPTIVAQERNNCLKFGYDHYRIHARQHLKAGNQNRAIPNAIDGIGREFYLTLDDDYFVFPDFMLKEYNRLVSENLDYAQSPLAFKGIYEHVTMGEKADAESMLFFELSLGRNYPRNFVFPRGTGTIFQFLDGKNSITDTGGFLVDYSSEDFGQGYIALVQQYSTILGSKKSKLNPGKLTESIHVIGEGVDLTGKTRQIERWMQGTGKVFFHLIVPVIFKCILKGQINLIKKQQFLSTFFLTSIGITFRFMTVLFYTLPFLLLLNGNYVLSGILEHVWLLFLILLFSIFVNFYMYFYKFGRVSFLCSLRLFLVEPLITMPSAIGYFKGLLGLTPNAWVANKTKKGNLNTFYGIYILIVINLISLFIIHEQRFIINIWSLLNLTLLIGGYRMFKKVQYPKDIPLRKIKPAYLNSWIILCFISLLLWILFYLVELSHPLNPFKAFIMFIMIFNTYISFRMMGFNIVLFIKQVRREKDL